MIVDVGIKICFALMTATGLVHLYAPHAEAGTKPSCRAKLKHRAAKRRAKRGGERCGALARRARSRKKRPIRWHAPSGTSGLGLTTEKRSRLWLDLGVYGSQSLSLSAATLGSSFRIHERVEAVLAMGALSALGSALAVEGEDDGPQTTSTTNTILGVNGLYEARQFRLKAGIMVSLPTLIAEANDLGRRVALSATYAQAIHGLHDPFRYQPNAVGVWMPVRIEDDFGRYLTTSVDLGLGTLIHATDGLDFGDHLYLHAALGSAIRLTNRTVFGLRLPISALIRLDRRSNVVYPFSEESQLSLEPYLAANLNTFMLSLRASIPVRGPVSSSAEAQALWVVRGTVGVHF